jgi:hypothetical protein
LRRRGTLLADALTGPWQRLVLRAVALRRYIFCPVILGADVFGTVVLRPVLWSVGVWR